MNDVNDICVGSTNPNNSDYEASQESQNMALTRNISKRGEQSPIATSPEDFENRSRPNRTKMSVNATRLNTNHPNLSSLENERSRGSHGQLNNGQNNIDVYHCKHCEYFTYFRGELSKHLLRRHPDERARTESEGASLSKLFR